LIHFYKREENFIKETSKQIKLKNKVGAL